MSKATILVAGIIAYAILNLAVFANGSQVRLWQNKSNEFEGEQGSLQVLKNGSGWMFVNASSWSIREAIVTCKDLGFQGLDTYTSIVMESSAVPTISGLYCSGNESHLSQCVSEDVPNTMSETVAAISCTGFPSVRLTGMSAPHQGLVEVFFNGSWGRVCTDHWDIKDIDVVCRQLGYSGALTDPGNLNCGSQQQSAENTLNIIIDDTMCTDTDFDIRLCRKTAWFTSNCRSQEESACVFCEPNKTCSEPLEISNGKKNATEDIVVYECDNGYQMEGGNELVCRDGQWQDATPTCVKVSHPEEKVTNQNTLLQDSNSNPQNDAIRGPRKGLVFGLLGAGLFLVTVIVVAVTALLLSRRVHARRVAHSEALNNLSAPLVVTSDGEELGEPDM